MSEGLEQRIGADTNFGFINSSTDAHRTHNPLLISNDGGATMLWAIRHELQRADRFCFSVAFVTSGAIALLKQALLDFEGTGAIITSTYLDFNEPNALRELLGVRNVDVYVHPGVERGFHPKGYLFNQGPLTTAIVGSSNLTSRALLQNEEWNLRVSALQAGDLVDQIDSAIDRQLHQSQSLTAEWIDEYEERYRQAATLRIPTQQPTPIVGVPTEAIDWEPFGRPAALPGEEPRQIVPNAMQVEALDSIDKIRAAGESRAVVISATGTGKTILAALDVRVVNPKRMLFVVHREQILDSAMQEFQAVLGLPPTDFGKFVGSTRELDRRFVFATIQSLSRPENLAQIDPENFDYVLIDEVHRAGAGSYRRVLDHLRPEFLLGITATPERTDGFNVFELFDFNVPYEIRLQAALEADMLSPFHYYGVTDYVDRYGDTIDETSDLSRLVANERVSHLCDALEKYGHAGETRGLMFCSRREEAVELSALLNEQTVQGRRLRTLALTGLDSVEARESGVEQLERGELDYLVTVDIFNEGIDIPTVNQVVMLRQTTSSIIFTQQLGRGLRKAAGKNHLRVIDFIGNYATNFLIPIALLGDSSLNKDLIRQQLIQVDDAGAISGLSSINFDKISRDRVLASLASVSLDSMARLKAAFLDMEQRLGQPPRLMDFARFDTVDPTLVATKYRNYWAFLYRVNREDVLPELRFEQALNFISMELLNGKRPHELLVLKHLLAGRELDKERLVRMLDGEGCVSDERTIESVRRVLSLEFFTAGERERYGAVPVIDWSEDRISLASLWLEMLQESDLFHDHVDDVIETGLFLARHRYGWTGSLQIGNRYSRKDACRLLNWSDNEYSTIYGYKVDRESNSCPIFVTYHKSDEVSESTQYEDEFIDSKVLKWYTRSRRSLTSPEIQPIISNEIPLHLFAKKDDVEGRDFLYLGMAESREPVQEKMRDHRGVEIDVVTMRLELESQMEEGLYRYLITPNGWGETG